MPRTTPDLLASAQFRKSSRSNNSSSCVEVAKNLAGVDGTVLVRDTKDRDGGVLSFSSAAWTAFTAELHNGTFDR